MFIPIRTDRRNDRVPWVNYGLIAANFVIFLLTYKQVQLYAPAVQYAARHGISPEAVRHWLPVVGFYLWPHRLHVYQFITYQFLHAGWMHLIGNMVFLWVFGNSVEDRLGRVGYLLFYLGSGVVAGIGYTLSVGASPVLGASGAIAGVTGAYLALFPLSNITIFFIFGFSFEIASIALILLQIGQNIAFQFFGIGHVAYTAHLAGYTYGFVIGMALLLSRILPREPYDMLSLIAHRRRRAQFKRMAERGYQPWESDAGVQTEGAEAGSTSAPSAPPPAPEQQALMDQRSAINSALAGHEGQKAAHLYLTLLKEHPDQVMGRQQQLDLANQLMVEHEYAAAAAAYELLMSTYPNYPQMQQVALILGLIYARYLDETSRARDLLNQAMPWLDGDDKDLAHDVLEEIGPAPVT